MPRLDETLSQLRLHFKSIARIREEIAEIAVQALPKNVKDEMQADREKQIVNNEALILRALAELVAFPPHHVRHFPTAEDFSRVAPYERSVFIMTKFPEGQDPVDRELERVITAVKDAVTACGFTPRIASERRYHPGLWDNVEAYLFGCQRGIAIVEDKYRRELNPNVAMEWGWMRGMGRDVLYLVERTFTLGRADMAGLLEERFDWDNPEPAITAAVRRWLQVDP